ncbi:MAG: MFS transporter [Ancalomicrobiaceae bacterium]|nr:MFS transporter [Ancalomicrobiaceae bacterium]
MEPNSLSSTLSQRIAAALARHNIHYGWVVVGVTFLTMLSTAGALGSAGVMIEPLQTEFGWSNADISTALAVRLMLFGLMGPFAAALMNHFGVKAVVRAALGLIAVGFVVSLGMKQLWQLMLLWGIAIGFGTGMTALVLGATVATRWFSRRRGLVVGMMTASTATGQLVFLPLMASLSTAYGWRVALGFVIAILMLALVLIVLFMRDYPSDVGLPRFGETEVTPHVAQHRSIGSLMLAPLQALREASGNSIFWVMFLSFYVCGLSTNGLIQVHWVSLCGDYGIAAVAAASMLAVIGVFDFFGTILSGWLSDRYDNRVLLFFYYGLRGVSLIYLPYSSFDLYSLSIFAVIYGLDWVATVPPTVKITAESFGAERAGLVFGWIFAGHQLGAATAAFGAGASRTEFSTYLPALYVAGAACIVIALLVVMSSRRRPVQAEAAE